MFEMINLEMGIKSFKKTDDEYIEKVWRKGYDTESSFPADACIWIAD